MDTPRTGTFWDMTTPELQKEIKRLLDRLNWPQSQAARIVYCAQNEDDDDKSISRFCETFRKKLNRPGTPPEWLREVLSILSEQPETRRIALSAQLDAPSPLPEAVRRAVRQTGHAMARQIWMTDEEA